MSDNLKTIRELADEFKVSKQAVRKRLTDEFRTNYVETVYSNGVATLVVTVSGYKLLKQHFSSGNDSEKVGSNVDGNVDVTSDNKQTTDNSYVIKILEQQLAVKDKQIENKDSQISQMQNLLDQQQRLALHDKKLLEEYKEEIKDLKVLPRPPHNDDKKEMVARSQTKKWWRFGR